MPTLIAFEASNFSFLNYITLSSSLYQPFDPIPADVITAEVIIA